MTSDSELVLNAQIFIHNFLSTALRINFILYNLNLALGQLFCLLKTGCFASNYLIKLRNPVCKAPKADIKMGHFSHVPNNENRKNKKNMLY
jgi:hypothetical protein